MKHIVPVIALSLSLLVLATYSHANASITGMFNRGFGGKIIKEKAVEIETLENSNYECVAPGTTITITPVGKYPISYLIPFGTNSKTGGKIKKGEWILGTYSPIVTTITCIYKGYPPVEAVVTLPTIKMYGTSGGSVIKNSLSI